jgi:hypothetical protein
MQGNRIKKRSLQIWLDTVIFLHFQLVGVMGSIKKNAKPTDSEQIKQHS